MKKKNIKNVRNMKNVKNLKTYIMFEHNFRRGCWHHSQSFHYRHHCGALCSLQKVESKTESK